MEKGEKKKPGLPASYVTGAVGLIFIILAYQAAVFINRAAVSAIMALRERPDTVYVVDSALAARLLGGGVDPPPAGGVPKTDGASAPGTAAVASASPGEAASSRHGKVTVARQGRHEAVISSPAPSSARRSVRHAENFRFDPNTAPAEDLMRLGFSEKQAAAIVNYRNKGGRFRRKSDFAKSFVVSDSVFRRLEAWIDIPLTDLNAADSAAFDDLPGIGGAFASRMAAYRTRLGGYSFKEQLLEIYGFDRERFDALADLVEVRPETAPAYPLWLLPEEKLAEHPYIGRRAARGIVLYRENNPPEKWTVDALEAAGVLDSGPAGKLRRCFILDSRPAADPD